jgi:hypothetical protein
VVSGASLDKMTTSAKLNDGSLTGYGYGLGVGKLDGHGHVSHGGGINGFITQLAYYPTDDVTVVVLGNTGSAPSSRVAQVIAKLVLGIELPVVKDVATTAEERGRLSGTYQISGATFTVKDEGGKLIFGGPGGPQVLKSQGDGRYIPERETSWVLTFAPASGQAQDVSIDVGDTVIRGKRKS